MKLSGRQQLALQVIEHYVEQNNCPPSVRDIMALMGLSSTSTAHGYLRRLRKKGLIEWESDKPRTLKVIR